MKKRILVCAYACLPRGITKWVGTGELILGWNIVKQLGRFFQVFVLTSSQLRSRIEAELQENPLINVAFHYVDLPRWFKPLLSFEGGIHLYAYLWQLKAYFIARNLHRRYNFQVFHHVTYANDWMASFIGALLPVPYIRGPGGGAHKNPMGFLQEYNIYGRLWEKFREMGQWLLRHDPFFIMGQRHASAILVCNREALEALPRKLQNKAILFPVNGISSRDLVFTKNSTVGKKKFRVISAGQLIRIKGFFLTIKAFKSFFVKYPDTELIIIGDGPELPHLKKLVNESELTTQVHFEKWMKREKLLLEMAKSDVFLFPSLRDGGGAVVVEAMASGIPVVCLDLAGPGFHIQNEWGIKIEAKNPDYVVEEMAKALEKLYLDDNLRIQMGKNARRRAEEYYLWDKLGERLQSIYEEALDIRG